MSDSTNRTIEDMTANLLLNKTHGSVSRQEILEAVSQVEPLASAMYHEVVSSDDILLIAKRLETRFNIRMELGALFADIYQPWLAAAKANIRWFYWDRYRRMLNDGGMSPNVIQGIDYITDQILDHLENPHKEGKWARKGMVVGHVQSGKTANYVGVVNKAADSGYRVIIVLAGTLNSLRSQTQERVDRGFIGVDTSIEDKPRIGVGELSPGKTPNHFTTKNYDFRKSNTHVIGVGIESLRHPSVLVIKKNPSTLANLIDWLKYNNPHNLKDHPMLLIDDEADYASINTSKSGEKVTAINGKIRELLKLFDRSSYVGYTATPFANVFIDPDTPDAMIGDDLFPRDFIISLDPPSNYVGATKIFSSEKELDIVRVIADYEDYLPAKHKIGLQVPSLPPSCGEAIATFILARAIRLLRGQTKSHNSMLVNVSRFTKVQSQVKSLVDDHVKSLQQAIVNYSKLSEHQALASPTIKFLKEVWQMEYAGTGTEWMEIQTVLKDAVSPVEVVEVNSLAVAASLDFSHRNYPNGRSVIAVGGLSLSRGLTLEGLTVSYFLRNSIMYDTLMQMGRWFGYRDGYVDLCRIYMSAETRSWYEYISDAMEELRGEFRRMQAAGMTPKDFGLAVRSHPDSLVVTARNKMRTGQYVTREIDLAGFLTETAALHRASEQVVRNMAAMEQMIERAKAFGNQDSYSSGSYLWTDVPSDYVLDFVGQFQNHPESFLTETGPVRGYIKLLADDGRSNWDVLLVSPHKSSESHIRRTVCALEVQAQLRANPTATKDGTGVVLNKRRVASRGLEKAGLSPAQIDLAESEYRKVNKTAKNFPDRAYRVVRERPLLMLHLLDVKDGEQSMYADGVVAYGISFPGEPVARGAQKKRLVQYVVNTTWWKNQYSDLIEDDEDDLGIDE